MTTKDKRKKSPPTVGVKTVAKEPDDCLHLVNGGCTLNWVCPCTDCPDYRKVRMIEWNGMRLVKMSDVPGLRKWMYGQTQPLVVEDPSPYDWVYYDDYRRFINGLPVID